MARRRGSHARRRRVHLQLHQREPGAVVRGSDADVRRRGGARRRHRPDQPQRGERSRPGVPVARESGADYPQTHLGGARHSPRHTSHRAGWVRADGVRLLGSGLRTVTRQKRRPLLSGQLRQPDLADYSEYFDRLGAAPQRRSELPAVLTHRPTARSERGRPIAGRRVPDARKRLVAPQHEHQNRGTGRPRRSAGARTRDPENGGHRTDALRLPEARLQPGQRVVRAVPQSGRHAV